MLCYFGNSRALHRPPPAISPRRTMGWGHYNRSSKPAPIQVSYEKQVLALHRSCSEFGLTSEEVQVKAIET